MNVSRVLLNLMVKVVKELRQAGMVAVMDHDVGDHLVANKAVVC